MNKYRLTKYIQKELLENIRDEFSSKEIILAAEKLASKFLKKTKNTGYSYNTLRRNFYEKEVDEIIQYQAWEVLEDFHTIQSSNDEISLDKQQKLKEFGVSLAAWLTDMEIH